MKYQKAEEKVVALEAEIDRNRNRRGEAIERMNEASRSLEESREKLKAALVGEDQKRAIALQEQISELKDKVLLHDQLLVAGLDDQHEQLQKDLEEVKAAREKAIAKACRLWLAKEVGQYDQAAKAVRERIQRLQVAFHILRDIGAQDVYREALGPAWRHLNKSRVLPAKDFNVINFTSGIRWTNPVFDAVKSEILGKE